MKTLTGRQKHAVTTQGLQLGRIPPSSAHPAPSAAPWHPGTCSLWRGSCFHQVSSPKTLPFGLGTPWRCVLAVPCHLPLSSRLGKLSAGLPKTFYDIGSWSWSQRGIHFSAKWRGRQQQWRKEKRSCRCQRRAATAGEWKPGLIPSASLFFLLNILPVPRSRLALA